MASNDFYNQGGNEGGYGGNEQRGEGYGGSGGGGYGGSNEYSSGGGNYSGQEGAHHPTQHSSGTPYGGGAAYSGATDDYSSAAQHASSHAGDSGDSSLFSTALGLLSGNKSKLQEEDVDEDDAVQQHKKMYGSGEGHQQQEASSQNVGAAAAMQALKMFTGGSESEGKGGQNKFIGMAMAQAAQLFDQQSSQGKTVSGFLKCFVCSYGESVCADFVLASASYEAGCCCSGCADGVEDVYEGWKWRS
jgi:hypothetical protein